MVTAIDPNSIQLFTDEPYSDSLDTGSLSIDPSSIVLERTTNCFLRAGTPELKAVLGMPQAQAVDVFAELRRRKDVF